MKRLYIDFDGVIIDTIPLLYEAFEKNGLSTDSDEDKEKRSKFLETYDFGEIIKDKNILNDSINCINKIIESKRFEISFLSHINSLNEGRVKVRYLRRHFKNITIILVPIGMSKTKMINSKDAILIDDYSGNLREWIEAGGIAIRFSKTLDSKGYKVIDRLDKILDMFDKNGEEIC